MAPSVTESKILTSFILGPAPLPTILTLKAFTELFPKSQRSSPQIKLLYRDLQASRAKVLDEVAGNIEKEVKRGDAQRREVGRVRREGERDSMQDEEMDVEVALYGNATSNLPVSNRHTLKSIIPEVEAAMEEVEDEIQRLEMEAETLLEEMRSTVGGLSDLRYGRLANGQLREKVLEGLGRLEAACEK